MKCTYDMFANSYKVKMIPDIFYCDENGKVIYYSDNLQECYFENSNKEEGKWKCTVVEKNGNIKSWFDIQRGINSGYIERIYLRTTKENCDGSNDSLCLMIIPSAIGEIKSGFEPDSYFSFPISFYFSSINSIEDHLCPNYGRDDKGDFVIDASNGAIKMDTLRKARANAMVLKSDIPEKKRYLV